jgi:hypothetical protein
MDKQKRDQRGAASDNPAEAGRTSATDSQSNTQSNKEMRPGRRVPGQDAQGDYQSLPADLDGMHSDSTNAAVQAAGSTEEAAEAARQAARDAGREADALFTGSPGEEGPAPNIPSTLNLDRSASAARTGREEMAERLREHTEASPEISAGDVDADWVSGEFVGDETPAGDNPTPGMSTVEDVGKAIGVDYEDAEELKGAAKVEERDRHRWELDPASSEDYEERQRDDGKQ